MRKLDEQRYLWLFRVFGIFLVISIFLNMILYIAFEKISPTLKKEVFFISSEGDEVDTIYITNTNKNFEINQGNVGYEIAKNYISQYIIDRESLFSSREEMQQLWGLDGNIYSFSSKKVYEDFIKSSNYQKFLINKDKEVIITTIDDIEYQNKSKKWIAKINLKIKDVKGLLLREEIKNIEIIADFINKNRKLLPSTEWKNPLGFQITKYEYIK